MRKQLEDFLMDVSEFYPIPSSKNYDKVISLAVEYLIEFCAGKEFDFKKALHSLFDRYKFKSFPDLGIIKDCILENEKIKYGTCKDEGKFIVMEIPEINHTYTFEVASFGKSLEEYKKDAISRYKNVKINVYPKGTIMIGEKIITP